MDATFENDTQTKGSTTSTPTAESIAAATGDVFGRHSTEAGGAAGPGQAPGGVPGAAGQAPGVLPGSALDPELVRKSICGLLGAFDSICCRRLYGAAYRVAAFDPALPSVNEAELKVRQAAAKDFAASFVAETAITEDEKNNIAELAAVVCAKWNFNAKYAPECALALVTVGYVGRMLWFAPSKLADIASEKKAEAARVKPASN